MASGLRSRLIAVLLRVVILAAVPAISTCGPIDELCTPQRAEYGFFSRGDCIFTKASFFQGHEWITVLANGDLDARHRFSDRDIASIAEGNRRVDWPKEVLVHMNTSVLSYMNALNAYTEVPSRQSAHFLLTERNTSAEATVEAQALLRSFTWEAIGYALADPARSLVAIGKANHLIQDSFSDAHARRDLTNARLPNCVLKVKAYIQRAPGFETADIEYHGQANGVLVPADEEDDDDDDKHETAESERVLVEGIGHITTQDSIYREGRDCKRPSTAGGVDACMSDSARRARTATSAYLAMMSELLMSLAGNDASGQPSAVSAVDKYIAAHLSMCPSP